MPSNATDKRQTTPLVARPRWGGAILICGKCLKRHDAGKVLRKALKVEALRAGTNARAASDAKGRKPETTRKPEVGHLKIIKTACIGLCPRGAVVLASPATLTAGDVLLVRGPDEIAAAVERLLPRG